MQILLVGKGKGRDKKRVPHIDMGGGLLRPVPEQGHAIAQAAYDASLDVALSVPPAPPVQRLTVLRRPQLNGATAVSGGTRQRQHKDRSYYTGEFTRREWHLLARAVRKLKARNLSKDYDCWKNHRHAQSRQRSFTDFFCTA